MYFSYKKFPELSHLDDDEKYEALKFCVGKSKSFSYLFLPCLFAFAYLTITLSDHLVATVGLEQGPILKLLLDFVPAFLLNLAFILLCIATSVHSLVKTYINEYKKT
jgi:hypothetical protein